MTGKYLKLKTQPHADLVNFLLWVYVISCRMVHRLYNVFNLRRMVRITRLVMKWLCIKSNFVNLSRPNSFRRQHLRSYTRWSLMSFTLPCWQRQVWIRDTMLLCLTLLLCLSMMLVIGPRIAQRRFLVIYVILLILLKKKMFKP